MTPANMNEILKGLVVLELCAHKASTDFGYWAKSRTPIEVISLIQTELSRIVVLLNSANGDLSSAKSKKISDHTEVEEQLADVIIRVMDFASYYNLDVSSATVAKMKYNHKLSSLTANASNREL